MRDILKKKWLRGAWRSLTLMMIAVGVMGFAGISAQAGFRQTADGDYRYYSNDGSTYAKGFKTVKGSTYYFDKKGYMQTGWVKIGKYQYHFADNGVMTKNRWYGPYFLQKNGRMAVGKWIGNRYVGKDGAWIQGYSKKTKPGFASTAKGTKYRKADGKYAKREWQLIRVDGKASWHYFYSNGIMARNTWLNDTFHVDARGRLEADKWIKGRYVGKDGELVRNTWVKNKYYVDFYGRKVRSTWVDDHYVGSNGRMVRSRWVGKRYLKKDGTLAKDCWIGSRYVDKNGNWVKGKKKM